MYNLKKDPHVWEDMKVHVKRFFTCFTHFFTTNQYAPKNRKGFEDLPHAYINLFVEFSRSSPYHAGHWFGFLFLLFLASLFF